jgi:hypothetical protein
LLLSWKLFYGKEGMLEQQQQRKMMKMQLRYTIDDEERCKCNFQNKTTFPKQDYLEK